MIILYTVAAYLAVGLGFSVPFLIKWIHQVDETSQETDWTFKLTILPGCIAFWPVLLRKYLQSKSEQQ
jgi:hypothetical protein